MDQPSHIGRVPVGWWDRLDRLVGEACDLPPSNRAAFLAEACPDDPEMRAEASSLLAFTDPGEHLLASLSASLAPLHSSVTGEVAELDPFVGRTIHQYAIESRIGSGGMGVVYRARDTRLGRTVALKFIWPHLNADPAGRQRLLDEAQAAAALDHPNVCTVYEVGEIPDGGLFIAMGYYEGETLRARLARSALPLPEALSVIRQIAEGVRAAHARGIIHCDIKPGNILITPAGVAKLLDFGIAEQPGSLIAGTGRAIGTLPYMSPEQIRGEKPDTRSDIWALGVLACEMLTGRRPFDCDTPAGMLNAIVNPGPRPLAAVGTDVPSVVAAVVKKALARDPDARQATVTDFLGELDRAFAAIGAHGPTVSSAAPLSSHRAWQGRPSGYRLAMLLLIGVLLVGATALQSVSRHSSGGDTFITSGAAAVPLARDESPASVAVLRFEDPDAVTESWMTDGITEAVQSELRRIDGLRVVGHFTSLVLSGAASPGALFGNDAPAGYLLSGTVHRRGDSILVTPQLVDVHGNVIWRQAYSAAMTPASLGNIPREVARSVAGALVLRPPAARSSGTSVPDASTYESYLEGRFHLRRFQSGMVMTGQELQQSVAHLRKVVNQAPSWAPGHAALGEALSWVGMFEAEQGRLDTAFAEAGAVLEQALALDPLDARAQATMGYVLHRRDLDFAAAETRFRRAMVLDPDQYWHCGYGFFLLWSGRYDEAARVYRRAEARDPLYPTLKDFLAASYVCTGQYDDAIATSEAVLADYPHLVPVRRSLVLALHGSGREEEAFLRISEAAEPDEAYWDILRALLHARAGRHAEAESLIRGLDEEAATNSVRATFPARQVSPAPLYAAVLVKLGRSDEAIRMLSAALERDPAVLLYDRCYPELASLQSDPRYRALLRRSGIPLP